MIFSLCLLAPLVYAIGHPSAQTPPSNRVSIADVSYSGSACPANSVTPVLTPDYSTLILKFTNPKADTDLTCNMQFTIKHPHGWQFFVESTRFQGNLNMGDNGSGKFDAMYRLGGGTRVSSSARVESLGKGPFVADSDVDAVMWSSCGVSQLATVASRVDLSGAGSANIVAPTGRLEQIVGLQWRRC